MGAAVDARTDHLDEDIPLVKIPRPIEGGTYTEQSLWGWVDRLMGERRYARRAAERLEPLFEDRSIEPSAEKRRPDQAL